MLGEVEVHMGVRVVVKVVVVVKVESHTEEDRAPDSSTEPECMNLNVPSLCIQRNSTTSHSVNSN